ncbi:MAG TPA: TCP-1/cpn60 chaperonin family protein [Candidatus Deferrimicrobium sp.]|nr:TCP-1/cpn60 chaperonin family protein [Candidatus Deferrimicrobium sp.]
MKNNSKSPFLGDPNQGIYNAAVKQYKDTEIRKINFHIVFSLAELIKRMFGPKGLNKMLIRPKGEVLITQKGSKVIPFFKTRLPITQLLSNLIETQEKLCGDGTKSVILLTAFLLEKAKKLLELGIAPQTINIGLLFAIKKALDTLETSVVPINKNSEGYLKDLLRSIMMNKLSFQAKEYFIDLILNSMENLIRNNLKDFDFSNIKFRKVVGKSIKESELINGMVIYKNRSNPKAPTYIKNPKILLIRRNLDFFIPDNVKLNREIIIQNPTEYNHFLQFNTKFYRQIAENLKKHGIDAIFCQKKMNTYFIEYCADIGILALELFGDEEINTLSKLLKIPIISNITNFSEHDIGIADELRFKKLTNDEILLIKSSQTPIFTFLLRGGNNYILEELEECLHSALKVTIQTMKDQKVLPGGGALESEIADVLKKYSLTFYDRLQYVLFEFGTAFENLPAFLILNSAGDPLELIPNLRKAHASGQKYFGFNCYSQSIQNVVNQGILDGYQVKKHLIKIAGEVARQIIRIDGLIMVTNKRLQETLDAPGKAVKSQEHEDRLREFFKRTENKMFSE